MNLRLDIKILKLWPKLVDHYSTVSKVNEIKDELVTITPDGQYSSNTQSRDSFIIEKPNGENELLMMFLFYSSAQKLSVP